MERWVCPECGAEAVAPEGEMPECPSGQTHYTRLPMARVAGRAAR